MKSLSEAGKELFLSAAKTSNLYLLYYLVIIDLIQIHCLVLGSK